MDDDSASDNDRATKSSLRKKSNYRPESKVIDYDDINLWYRYASYLFLLSSSEKDTLYIAYI